MTGTPGANRFEYEVVIGLEVHAQLRTRTKMFCACATEFAAAPNSQVCPVCLGHPGVLPTVNRRAVALAVRAALAAGGRLRHRSRWARKNYFYPDLPKGYQITQYDEPLSEGGAIEIGRTGERRQIRIRRMHLEEDAGRLKHPVRTGESRTRIDLNRCGVPLLEIVSEPDLRTAEDSVAYVSELKQLLQFCGVCEGEMEKGNLRCDANLSLRRAGADELGTRTEIKNLNSLRGLSHALTFEIRRQSDILSRGGRITAATLLWDPERGVARILRSKEGEEDYRYFPEPDLPPLVLPPEWIDEIRAQLPERPAARRARLVRDYRLRDYDADLLTGSRALADYFEAVVDCGAEPQSAAHFIASELLRALREQKRDAARAPVPPAELAALLRHVAEGRLTGRQAKQVFAEMVSGDGTLSGTLAGDDYGAVSDRERLRQWVAEVLATHPQQVAEYRCGKDALLRFFVGEVMKLSGGRADPRQLTELLERALRGEGPPPRGARDKEGQG